MLVWVRSCLAVAQVRPLLLAGSMAELRAVRCTDLAIFYTLEGRCSCASSSTMPLLLMARLHAWPYLRKKRLLCTHLVTLGPLLS